jgi:hypothetical protein
VNSFEKWNFNILRNVKSIEVTHYGDCAHAGPFEVYTSLAGMDENSLKTHLAMNSQLQPQIILMS